MITAAEIKKAREILTVEIKKAREILKKSEYRIKNKTICYDIDESFILVDLEKLEKVTFSTEEMLAIADWVQCLFIDDGG
jgi:predicted protein tyrosine phosphatase